jgi:hypothetical protein
MFSCISDEDAVRTIENQNIERVIADGIRLKKKYKSLRMLVLNMEERKVEDERNFQSILENEKCKHEEEIHHLRGEHFMECTHIKQLAKYEADELLRIIQNYRYEIDLESSLRNSDKSLHNMPTRISSEPTIINEQQAPPTTAGSDQVQQPVGFVNSCLNASPSKKGGFNPNRHVALMDTPHIANIGPTVQETKNSNATQLTSSVPEVSALAAIEAELASTKQKLELKTEELGNMFMRCAELQKQCSGEIFQPLHLSVCVSY